MNWNKVANVVAGAAAIGGAGTAGGLIELVPKQHQGAAVAVLTLVSWIVQACTKKWGSKVPDSQKTDAP